MLVCTDVYSSFQLSIKKSNSRYHADMSQYSYLSWETTEEAVPEVNQCEGKVLVEEVAQEVTHAEVGPAAVHQEEPLQVPKLSEGVIWGQNSLRPLLTADTHTNMSHWGRNTQCGSLPFEIYFKGNSNILKNINHHWIITDIFTIFKMTNLDVTLKLVDYFHSC